MVAVKLYFLNIDAADFLLQTANSATFMLHAIARNPEVQEQLYAEITSVLGDSRLPTSEDLAAMPYVKAVLKETLR